MPQTFLSRGVYGHFEISPRDSCIIAQLAFASFYRSQSREMGTMLEEYLESVTKIHVNKSVGSKESVVTEYPSNVLKFTL